MSPGTYTTVFRPRITFTTDSSWVSFADSPRFVQFERADEHGGIAFEYVNEVFDPATDHQLMPPPKDYASWLIGLPGVKLIAGPEQITVDGIEATEVDLQATKDAPTVDCDDPCVAVWPLGPSEVAAISSVWVTRLVVLRLRGKTVEIAACCAPGTDFALLAKDFDAIVRSIRFG